jgi:hypothetical protein
MLIRNMLSIVKKIGLWKIMVIFNGNNEQIPSTAITTMFFSNYFV